MWRALQIDCACICMNVCVYYFLSNKEKCENILDRRTASRLTLRMGMWIAHHIFWEWLSHGKVSPFPTRWYVSVCITLIGNAFCNWLNLYLYGLNTKQAIMLLHAFFFIKNSVFTCKWNIIRYTHVRECYISTYIHSQACSFYIFCVNSEHILCIVIQTSFFKARIATSS